MQNKFFGSKLNTALLLVLIILMVIALRLMWQQRELYLQNFGINNDSKIPIGDTKYETDKSELLKNTSTYTNHGFSIEVPKGFIPKETESEGGPSITISMSDNSAMVYVTDVLFWEKSNIPSFKYLREEKIGENTFKVYQYNNETFYWYKKGNVGYEFHGDKKQLETFKFVGWN
jgi:hypothetical protein